MMMMMMSLRFFVEEFYRVNITDLFGVITSCCLEVVVVDVLRFKLLYLVIYIHTHTAFNV